MFRKAVLFVMLCSISISVMGCDNATSVNHNSNNSEMTTPAEERDDDYTIFDNIVHRMIKAVLKRGGKH